MIKMDDDDDEPQQQQQLSPPLLSAAQVDPSILASKRVVFIGGLPDEATATMVRAAMIPFGDIRSVDMPMDYVKGRHRGFAFVEYEDADDADEAIFNMDGAELSGRTVSVSVAQPNQVNRLLSSSSSGNANHATTAEAIWKSDEWFQKQVLGVPDKEAVANERNRETDAKTLQEA